MNARQVAVDALRRIDEGAYANIVVPALLDQGDLRPADRRFVTDLVYGTTRRRRAVDGIVDRFVNVTPDPPTRRLLRLGAYQLVYGGVAPHAAVSETVSLAPRRTRGFVNAVLRRVAALAREVTTMGDVPGPWASPWAALSYPDWLAESLVADLGHQDALAALERMNEAPPVRTRSDGYVQDLASEWVAHAVEAADRETIIDLCAAPGGKTTAMAAHGADIVAADVRPARARLTVANIDRLGSTAAVCIADGRRPPFRPGSADAVLLDAPCSGLGALRRRPDARWRISRVDIDDLIVLQRDLLTAAAELVRPDGRLVFSVCTMLDAESFDHATPKGFIVDDAVPIGTWRAVRQGWRVLPHDADTDGMTMIRYRRTS